ncbi:hypothetical protein [Lysobacter auxotrophicus]|uniref:Uncharacterized protein n=1 Tax=Lysobacter auxotrophicus TaxID=2992573 RepID=A0ABN6UK38_9GAMM|nr:hypothetical protein [Lysobacter auxotrophicus]BDU16673.1 hypothetical protein LA521A_18740 [Lysobacter auxotrophicus]
MKAQDDPRARDAFAAFLRTREYGQLPDDEKYRLWEAFLWAWVPEQLVMRIVLDGPPAGPERSGRFVDIEDAAGYSIRSGRWHEDEKGRWVLEVAPSRAGPSIPLLPG